MTSNNNHNNNNNNNNTSNSKLSMKKLSGAALKGLFQSAQGAGTLSASSSALITGHLGNVVIAGAAGMDAEDIVASDVTLITLLVDASSSIQFSRLESAVRTGQHELLDAMQGSREKDSVLMALWTFNHEQEVLHAYVPVDDATRLDQHNYQGNGTTHLYDTWCDALAANVAYAQQLKNTGTPCRSVVVVITDGEDVGSTRSARNCKKLSDDLLASEQFVLAFVGVGDEANFRQVARNMGVPEGSILVQKDATPSGIRNVFQMVSRSAIKASQGKITPGPQAGFFT